MSKLKAILALLAGSFIKDLGEAFDKNFTSKEEKEAALLEKEKVYNKRLQLIAEMTDGDPDSWLSKNIRPLVFLIGFLTVSAMMILKLDVDPGLQKIYTTWVGAMVTLYFFRREHLKAKKQKKES